MTKQTTNDIESYYFSSFILSSITFLFRNNNAWKNIFLGNDDATSRSHADRDDDETETKNISVSSDAFLQLFIISVSLSFRYIIFIPSLRQTVLNASNHHLIDVTSAMGIASIDNYSIPYDSIFVAFVAFRFFLSLSLCAPSTI